MFSFLVGTEKVTVNLNKKDFLFRSQTYNLLKMKVWHLSLNLNRNLPCLWIR